MASITVPIVVNLPDDWIEQIVNRLRNDPDADWVEVIRCKDCVYKPCKMMPYSNDNDFCSYGLRRETDG